MGMGVLRCLVWMRNFEFELAVPINNIQRQTTPGLQWPLLHSAGNKSELPILVKHLQRA